MPTSTLPLAPARPPPCGDARVSNALRRRSIVPLLVAHVLLDQLYDSPNVSIASNEQLLDFLFEKLRVTTLTYRMCTIMACWLVSTPILMVMVMIMSRTTTRSHLVPVARVAGTAWGVVLVVHPKDEQLQGRREGAHLLPADRRTYTVVHSLTHSLNDRRCLPSSF